MEFSNSFDAVSVVSSTESWARIPREGLEKESTVIIVMPTGAQHTVMWLEYVFFLLQTSSNKWLNLRYFKPVLGEKWIFLDEKAVWYYAAVKYFILFIGTVSFHRF